MVLRYNLQEVEFKWCEVWVKVELFKVKILVEVGDMLKVYVFEMFLYLLGCLYMGYVCNYVMGDVVVRYKKVKGYNVLYFMGWDVFGMLVENVVMEKNVYLGDWMYQNIVVMKVQFEKFGLLFDWLCEFVICDFDYYGE